MIEREKRARVGLMNKWDSEMELWSRIRGLAGCAELPGQQDWDQIEREAVRRAFEGMAEEGGWPGRVDEEEVERLAVCAVGCNDEISVMREAFEELEQERFREFVDRCCKEWLEESQRVGIVGESLEESAREYEEEGEYLDDSGDCDREAELTDGDRPDRESEEGGVNKYDAQENEEEGENDGETELEEEGECEGVGDC